MYANYTHNPQFTKAGEPKLPGPVNDILNLSLAFEITRFSAVVSFNNTPPFSTVTCSLPDGKGDIYYNEVYYLDADVNFFLVKAQVLYEKANNLLNRWQRGYMWNRSIPIRRCKAARLSVKLNVF